MAAVTVVLPSLIVAVRVSAPSPMAVTSAASTATLHVPPIPTVTGSPIGSPAALVKVMMSPTVPVPVTLKPAAAS